MTITLILQVMAIAVVGVTAAGVALIVFDLLSGPKDPGP